MNAMMDLDAAFVSSVLAEGRPALKLCLRRDVRPEILTGDGLVAWNYLLEHLKTYQEIPSPEVIWGKTGISLPAAPGKAEFFIDEVLNRRRYQLLDQGQRDVRKFLEDRKIEEADELWSKVQFQIRQERLGRSSVSRLKELAPGVLEFYEAMKAGKRGIPFPWEGMTEATLGMWAQDLILFAARLGVGKTWTMLLIAKAAWLAGYRVLIATTEMPKDRLMQRFMALHMKLPYAQFRRGKLDTLAEERLYKAVQDLMEKDDNRLSLIGGDFDFRIENLAAAIEEDMPELVVLDGAYLIRAGDDLKRTENAAEAFNGLKRIFSSAKIAGCVSSQFNRKTDKEDKKTTSIENVALTDVAGWNADVAYGLFQDEDMYHDRRMVYKALKVREGAPVDIETKWDLNFMEFDEVKKDVGTNNYSHMPPPTSGQTSSSDEHASLF